ncbi:3092_t:CDS:1, partial [Gigaspora rosea]
EKNQNTEKSLILIRPGQKSMIILNQRQFTIRIVLLDNNIYIPGHCAESLYLFSKISISTTTAISSLFQQLFNKNTKFSGPLLLGWDDNEIIKELISDIFFPFSISYNKLSIFIYGIGVSNKLELKNASNGYHATILNFYKKKQSQFIQYNTCKIQIICENKIEAEYTDSTPHAVWKKVWNDSNILYEYDGMTLFGINSSNKLKI